MGNWNISIRGVGPHHNAKDFDAEQIAARFVDELKRNGHTVVSAEVTYGGVEVLEDGRYGGERPQSRALLVIGQTLRVGLMLLAAGFLLAASPVWAQIIVSDAALQVTAADVLPASEPSALGSLLQWVSTAVLGLILLGVSLLGVYLRGRAKDSKVWGAVNSLWVLMQTAVAHAEAELRPKIAKALADGKLTPEEGAALKAKVLEIFKSMAGEKIRELADLLKLGETGVGVFLSGLLERAVAAGKSPGVPGSSSPTSSSPAPAPGNQPSP